MKNKPAAQLDFEKGFRLFAVANDSADLDFTVEILSQAHIEVTGEGSRIHGYAVCVSDVPRAKRHITESHRFRTGDLHLFILQHPRHVSEPPRPEDSSAISAWRISLARQRRNIV